MSGRWTHEACGRGACRLRYLSFSPCLLLISGVFCCTTTGTVLLPWQGWEKFQESAPHHDNLPNCLRLERQEKNRQKWQRGEKRKGERHRIEASEALGGIVFQGLTIVRLHKAQKTWVTQTACWDIKWTSMWQSVGRVPENVPIVYLEINTLLKALTLMQTHVCTTQECHITEINTLISSVCVTEAS